MSTFLLKTEFSNGDILYLEQVDLQNSTRAPYRVGKLAKLTDVFGNFYWEDQELVDNKQTYKSAKIAYLTRLEATLVD
jgi:hypothetical protein